MASRRDELNAYTFAKRRMLAAFVQPSATGSEENAPRPLRGVVPSIIVAVVILAGFGAWGMIRPTAPQDWDEPGEKVIVASDSTTRYVVLKTGGKTQLHPVLNMASAKLLLDDPDQAEVIKVAESVLDSGKIPHGVTIGIPYAPDRLPKAEDAGARKTWAVCQRPGGDGGNIQKAAFVFADREKQLTQGPSQLKGGELLYVQGPDKKRYVVDRTGTAYELDDNEYVLRTVVGGASKPEQVSQEWLDTLHQGDKVTFPKIDGATAAADVPGGLDSSAKRVGMVLKALDGGVWRHYVVLQNEVAPVSDFTASLLLNDPELLDLGQTGTARQVNASAFSPGSAEFGAGHKWPKDAPKRINSPAKGARNTICSVLHSVDAKASGVETTLTTWAGTSFPATLATGSTSAYVTPGSGQLFREPTGEDVKGGSVYLVTDTGLRYALHKSGRGTCTGSSGTQDTTEQTLDSKALLGYEKTDPTVVPSQWAEFLQKGPGLSREAACEPQGA